MRLKDITDIYGNIHLNPEEVDETFKAVMAAFRQKHADLQQALRECDRIQRERNEAWAKLRTLENT